MTVPVPVYSTPLWRAPCTILGHHGMAVRAYAKPPGIFPAVALAEMMPATSTNRRLPRHHRTNRLARSAAWWC